MGVEAKADEETSHACDVKLHLGEKESEVVFEQVTYEATLTADLREIYPRFGSVKGGTTVTFTG